MEERKKNWFCGKSCALRCLHGKKTCFCSTYNRMVLWFSQWSDLGSLYTFPAPGGSTNGELSDSGAPYSNHWWWLGEFCLWHFWWVYTKCIPSTGLLSCSPMPSYDVSIQRPSCSSSPFSDTQQNMFLVMHPTLSPFYPHWILWNPNWNYVFNSRNTIAARGLGTFPYVCVCVFIHMLFLHLIKTKHCNYNA